MKKLWFSPIVAIVAMFGLNVASAFAHDNAITAASVCTSQKDSTWRATFTGVNDYRLSEQMTFTGAVPGTFSVGEFGSQSVSVITSGNSVTDGIYGRWSDGYHNGPPANHFATATRPPGCAPVIHSPRIVGVSRCGTEGRWKATYMVVNSDNATGETPRLPAVHKGLTGKADSLTVTFSYSNGPDQTVTASTVRSKVCFPSKPLPAAVVRKPHAQFFGPCLDPEYAVDMWNGVHANHDVTIIWHYLATSGAGTVGTPVNVKVKLRPGQHYRAKYRRILGNSRMTVKTASGGGVISTTVVPPGDYGACAAVA